MTKLERELLEVLKDSTKWIAKVASDYDQGQSKYVGSAASKHLKRVNKVINKAIINIEDVGEIGTNLMGEMEHIK